MGNVEIDRVSDETKGEGEIFFLHRVQTTRTSSSLREIFFGRSREPVRLFLVARERTIENERSKILWHARKSCGDLIAIK